MKSLIHASKLVAFFAVVLLSTQGVVLGQIHRHHTCNRYSLPKHNYGHDNARFTNSEYAVANAVVETGDVALKPFHFRATELKLDHLTLDQVGLAIDKHQGKLIATGRITHNGGDGGLIGSNVTIRTRAYVAASADTFQIPPDAYVVWESVHHVWIPRGQEHISLVAEKENYPVSTKLQRYFDQITHLDVELEYHRDR